MRNEGQLRAVAFKEGDVWVVHGIEYDIVTQTKDPLDAPRAFLKTLLSTMLAYKKRGRNAFEVIKPAPAKYEEMWEQADVILSPAGPDQIEDNLPRPDITLKAYRQTISGKECH